MQKVAESGQQVLQRLAQSRRDAPSLAGEALPASAQGAADAHPAA